MLEGIAEWKSIQEQNFPGGPVVGTPPYQFRGPEFYPWSGNKIPYSATKSLYAAPKT